MKTRQESSDKFEAYRMEREVLELRKYRIKYLEVDLASLEEECYNLRKKIGNFQEKTRLADLFEYVSPTGHTIMSWAGAVGSGEWTERLVRS